MRCIKCITLFLLICNSLYAKGPINVAVITENIWPFEVSSKESFDLASRLEILMFLKTYKKELLNVDLEKYLGLSKDRIDIASIKRWEKETDLKLLKRYLSAMKTCNGKIGLGCDFSKDQYETLLQYSLSFFKKLDEKFQIWNSESQKFYITYAKEQIRLAALFPKPTSEIFSLSDDEINGDEFKDGEFLISLDDGPDKVKTKKYSELLTKYNINGIFFVLGSKLKSFLENYPLNDMKSLYGGHCIGSHGLIHKSHQSLKTFSDSITMTDNLIKKVSGEKSVYFRPPYGQRNEEVLALLKEINSKNILWNIDSNDWHAKISVKEMWGRVQKLMLLWRKGIILFHDVHDKAIYSISKLSKFVNDNELIWKSCSKL